MNQQQAITECKQAAASSPGIQYYVIRNGRRYSVISFDTLMETEKRPPVVYAAIETANQPPY